MDADSFNLKTLFGFERRHVVPLYQRPYVWEREGQWEPLWEDVRSLADRAFAREHLRPHFLGAIVIDQLKIPARCLDARLVIDGQQRLTTLQLLLAAFRDICEGLGLDKSRDKLMRLTQNDDAEGPEDDQRFKVWPTNADRAPFREVMGLAPGEAPDEKVRRAKAKGSGSQRIADAYAFFHLAIAEWTHAEGIERVGERVEALLEAVREWLCLVVIDLADEDDAQVIFETLNARGTPLLPADLVKNFLLHRAEAEGRALDALYEKHWKPFDSGADYWRKPVKQGRFFRPQVDLFLQHYLTLATRDEVPAAHLFAAFKDFAERRRDLTVEGHLVALSTHARIFRSFGEAPPDTRKRLFFQRLAILETTTVLPLLLGLYQRFGETEGDSALDPVLADLESFLVRRLVCRLTAKNYNRLFLDLLGRIDEMDVPPAEATRAYLLALEGESSRWPSDDEFLAAWMELPAYKALSRPRLRMLLEALEAQLHTEKSEDIVLRGRLTVEHLLPQSWESYWPLPEGADPALAKARREALLHRFGNLTLVTKSLNPSLSNDPWRGKCTEIRDHSFLALNRRVVAEESWDEEAIERRTAELFESARRVWIHPSARCGAD